MPPPSSGRPPPASRWSGRTRSGRRTRRCTCSRCTPGDDVVDLWGVHYYDSGPQKGTQALWDQYYGLSDNGGPWGIGAWLAAAQAHGKELGVGEWGLWRQDGQAAPAADDPVYIDNMYRFFRDHAPAIAYETYFDAMGVHALCPGVPFPAAAARYRADWSLGR